MIKHTRILSLIAAAAALLPVAAQAHWNSWCGCQQVHHRYYHYRYVVPREHADVAVELAPNVFAIPYHLRHYPYVSGRYGDGGVLGGGAPAVVGSDATGRGEPRVIDADAQVTILGPDRMNIRLFRKGRGVVIHSDQ